MKNLIKPGARLLLVLFTAVFLSAIPALAGQGAASFTGKVKDVDLQEKSVVAGSPDGDVVVYIEKETKIASDAQAAQTLADIKVGMIVRVVYTMAGEDKIAESVTLLE